MYKEKKVSIYENIWVTATYGGVYVLLHYITAEYDFQINFHLKYVSYFAAGLFGFGIALIIWRLLDKDY